MLLRFLKHYRQLVTTVLLVGLLLGGGHLPPQLDGVIFYLVVFGVALLAYTRNKYMLILIGCSTLTFLLAWLRSFQDLQFDLLFCISGLICLTSGIHSTLHFVLISKEVSRKEVFALINCYFIAGLTWAILYTLIEGIMPGSFTYAANSAQAMTDRFIYYSFATMTTSGDADMVPHSLLTQRLSVVQAVFGQFYFAIVVAYLIGKMFQGRGELSQK
jgi:hypothetical protein